MHVFKPIILFAILYTLLSVPGRSQVYVPDTSLNYDSFLKQCIEFKRERLGKEVWVVYFWASFSSHSMNMIPNLKVIREDFLHKPVRFVSVSEDRIKSSWLTSLAYHKMPWEQLMVPKVQQIKFLQRAFPYNSLPGIFVVNSMGKIRRTSSITALQTILQQETYNLPDRPYEGNTDSQLEDLTSGTSEPEATPITVSNPKPGPSSPTPTQKNPPAPQPDPVFTDASTQQTISWITHTVQPKETLYRLYVKYKVPVEEIKRINNLKSNNIRPGQVLKIRKK